MPTNLKGSSDVSLKEDLQIISVVEVKVGDVKLKINFEFKVQFN